VYPTKLDSSALRVNGVGLKSTMCNVCITATARVCLGRQGITRAGNVPTMSEIL
jgi:hypothetical protein